MNVDELTARYVAVVREDRNPTPHTVAMARAVRQHLEDLYADEDPGEGMTARQVERAYRKATDLVKTLERLIAVVFAATLTVQSSAPPLSPEDAVRVLRSGKSIVDRTDARAPEEPGPQVVVIRSRPGDGPFGPFPKFAPRPIPQGPSVIRFRLPRVKGGHRGKAAY